ncbi:MAG TPA: Calx-beta domain-containing protein [Steroidobacteraceae bacterium]|jgi:hypothetical protein|nr:Calx-beta domain-containing protein [Steroidobacteraceae bacterium]
MHLRDSSRRMASYLGIVLLATCGPAALASASGSPGVLVLGQKSYSVAQGAVSATVTVDRTGGTRGAISVKYATSNGTAVAGSDYTAKSGTLSWKAGGSAVKSFKVAVSSRAGLSGSKTFSIALSGATGGATLGTPASAAVTLMGGSSSGSAGSISLSAAAYPVNQSGGSVTINLQRTGGASGAVAVNYATADGTAVAGSNYTPASGSVSWANGDTSTKSFSVAVSDAIPFSGSKTFTVTLSGATDGAALVKPSSASVAITGSESQTGGCAQSGSSYTTSDDYGYMVYGNYVVSNNNWGGTPGQKFWANSANCWGVTTTATQDTGSPGSYPDVTRGWSDNGAVMQQQSDSGTNDWTTKSGMGISVTALTQATAHWAFTAPTSSARWMGLMDIYFHQTNSPSYTQFPPYTDLMIDQAMMDQVFDGTTYYAATAQQDHATTVTLGGVQFLIYIDDPSEAAFHNGGHTIHLFELPTADTSNNANPVWGSQNSRINIKAIIDYLRESNPVGDNGKPLENASGKVVTSPLISANLYLNAVNAGWEIIYGTPFSNTSFCLAMQNEAACP